MFHVNRVFVVLTVSVFTSFAAAKESTIWDAYYARLEHRCPERNVGTVPDVYLQIIDAFEETLTPSARKAVRARADIGHYCADEQMGFYCEMARSLVAYRQLGLLDRFVSFNCHHIRCEEGALCSELPSSRIPWEI
jgi:hypothetical protein